MEQEIVIKDKEWVDTLVARVLAASDRWLNVLKKSKITITIQTEANDG